ncbi:hypothetical protein GGR55DRAFT_675824 [Xylaria sp. FL0064]|nr:hypothetical protein GGR55DRAFT_675824 [Xylaria sp. FL0064]
MPSPRVFWRVEDEHSRAQTVDFNGISAEANIDIDFGEMSYILQECLARHLDWSDRTPSPFISTYSDEGAAYREADRRLYRGKSNVTITEINLEELPYGTVQYRNIRTLAKKLKVWIEEEAYNNSEYEYIFLNHVPWEAVAHVTRYG